MAIIYPEAAWLLDREIWDATDAEQDRVLPVCNTPTPEDEVFFSTRLGREIEAWVCTREEGHPGHHCGHVSRKAYIVWDDGNGPYQLPDGRKRVNVWIERLPLCP